MANLTIFEGLLGGLSVLARSQDLFQQGMYQSYGSSGSSSIVQSAVNGLGSTQTEFAYGLGTPDSFASMFSGVNDAARNMFLRGLPADWPKTTMRDAVQRANMFTNYLINAIGIAPLHATPVVGSYTVLSLASSTHDDDFSVMAAQLARRKVPNTRNIAGVPLDLHTLLPGRANNARL